MNHSTITAALAQLVRATGRNYQVRQDDDQFILVIPTGGSYPSVDANAMVARLVNLRICAEGRLAR